MDHLFDALARVASLTPDKILLTFRQPAVDVRAGELLHAAQRFSGGLQSLGLAKGDRVAIFCDKRAEFVTALLACLRLGLIAVPVNPVLKPRQVGHILADCSARVLVTTRGRAKALAEADADAVPTTVFLDDAGGLPGHAWSTLMSADVPVRINLLDSDPAALLYTSGSTGKPKGVILTQRNLLAGATSVNQYLGHEADDVILSLLPLSFDAGLNQLTMALSAGVRVVLLNYMRPAEVIAACRDERPTTITGVPPLWMQLAAAEWGGDGRSVRRIANTGGHMPRALLDKLRALFPNALPFLMYGLTEAFRSTYLDPAEVDRRPDSIGKAVPNAEILVLRPDGTPCGADEPGELVHRGAFVTRGYWNDPERTAQRFRPLPSVHGEVPLGEPAVWSGDIVRRDADGFLYFVGRNDDMIKTLGNRVSSTEVEDALFDCRLVREAAVVGVPDEQRGQAIWAVVALQDEAGAQDVVVDHCRRLLPNYMVPVRFLVRAELPRNANGKIDRTLLKQELLAELAATQARSPVPMPATSPAVVREVEVAA